MSRRRFPLHLVQLYWRYPALGLILAALFSLFVSQVRTEISLTIDAAQEGVLAIYWPNNSGKYVSVAIAEYPRGESRQTIAISRFSNSYPLRFDPFVGQIDKATGDLQQQVVHLRQITSTRPGAVVSLTGQELLQRIVDQKEVTIEQEGIALKLVSSSEDPQIYFNNPVKFVSVAFLVSLYTLAMACLMAVIWVSDRRSRGERQQSSVLFATVVLLTILLYFSTDYIELILTSLLLTLVGYYLLRATKDILSGRDAFSFFRSILPVSLFLLIICAPLALSLQSSRYLQFLEEETTSLRVLLAQLPTQSQIKNAIVEFEERFLKYHAFRPDLLHLNALVKLQLFGYSPSSKVILGKEGMFFEGHGMRRVEDDDVGNLDTISDYLGILPFSEDDLEQWRIVLEERYYWLKEHDIAYLFVLAPNKSQIYPEYYPEKIASFQASIEHRRYDQLVDYLKAHSVVPVVDLRAVLLTAKEQAERGEIPNHRLFYRTDGHWNGYGVFWAYWAVAKAINESYPQFRIPIADVQDYDIRQDNQMIHRLFRNLLGLQGNDLLRDTYITLFPKEAAPHAARPLFAKRGINIDESCGVKIEGNPAGQVPYLLIAGDSFGHHLVSYFRVHSQHIGFKRHITKFDPKLIEKIHPDLYIQEILNMYLLYKVPENPPQMKAARMRATMQR